MPEPASTSPVELPMKAIRGFVCRIDGRKRYVNRGETVPAGDPLLAKHPESFVEITATPQETKAARVSLAGKRHCTQCRGRFYRDDGFEGFFCSEGCFRERKKALSKIMKSASKGKIPSTVEDIEAALDDVASLRRAWRGREGGLTIETPSPRARSVVRRYTDALRSALTKTIRERRRENERRHEKARKDALRQAVKQDQEATAEAREELLKSAGNISKGS